MKKYIYILFICYLIIGCSEIDIEETEEETIESTDADATGYPFTLPSEITATLSINTSVRENANNLLLGTNFGNFETNNDKEIVRFLNPVTVRFPSGVWSNWYNWENDISEYENDGYDIGDFHRRVMDTWKNNSINTGFPGLKLLHDEMGFNMLFTYNVNYDSNEKSVARLKDREQNGFDVRYIELGNEQFWKNQRSARIATPELYYPVAKSISAALKAEKPEVKISVPLGWRTNQDIYNATIATSTDYFDAITLHKYVHHEKDESVKSKEAYKNILTSRLEINEAKDFVLSFAPGKSIWLSEWGVSCGLNAASYLGQADAYIYLFENQDVFERAEWYGATTALNSMYTFTDQYLDNGGRPEKSLRNLKKTGHGAVYEILRSVFENSELLETSTTSHNLIQTSNAVEARAVEKNGKIEIFVINKTFKSVPLALNIDSNSWQGALKHEALSFNSLFENQLYNTDFNPLKVIKEGPGDIILPPYSINKLSNINP